MADTILDMQSQRFTALLALALLLVAQGTSEVV
jgi:hypothetical protein